MSEPLVGRAETLGYPPLHTEALLTHGAALATAGEHERAEPELERALRSALAWRQHGLAAEAGSRLVSVVGYEGLRFDEALAYAEVAWGEALAGVLASEEGPRKHLLEAMPRHALAEVLWRQGTRLPEARELAETALALRTRPERPARPDILAETQFLLARLLWSDRAERPRARELATKARDAYAEFWIEHSREVAEIEAWLRDHGGDG